MSGWCASPLDGVFIMVDVCPSLMSGTTSVRPKKVLVPVFRLSVQFECSDFVTFDRVKI